jgi:hypothetical protein
MDSGKTCGGEEIGEVGSAIITSPVHSGGARPDVLVLALSFEFCTMLIFSLCREQTPCRYNICFVGKVIFKLLFYFEC